MSRGERKPFTRSHRSDALGWFQGSRHAGFTNMRGQGQTGPLAVTKRRGVPVAATTRRVAARRLSAELMANPGKSCCSEPDRKRRTLVGSRFRVSVSYPLQPGSEPDSRLPAIVHKKLRRNCR